MGAGSRWSTRRTATPSWPPRWWRAPACARWGRHDGARGRGERARGGARVIRHQLAVLVRTRAALAPAAAFLFVLLGVYAYRDSGVGPTYAFTALLLCPIVAWLAAAAAFAEPLTQQQVAMAAAGGPGRALRGRVLALAALGAGLALVDVAFPAVFGLFDRTPAAADLAAAALAHLACAALGIGLGLLVAPPTARRPNAAFVVIVAYAVLVVPLYDLAPVLSPVAWLAATLDDAAPRTLDAAVGLGALAAIVQAGLAVAAGEALRRRAG